MQGNQNDGRTHKVSMDFINFTIVDSEILSIWKHGQVVVGDQEMCHHHLSHVTYNCNVMQTFDQPAFALNEPYHKQVTRRPDS